MKIDMHVHTKASDGDMEISEIVEFAKRREVSVVAITDHDTLPERSYTDYITNEVSIIPGIEFSCDFMNKNVHILGYFIDVEDKVINEKLSFLRARRIERTKKIIEKLNAEGIMLSYDDIKKDNSDDMIGRMHIAFGMVEKGYVKSVKESFGSYIGDGEKCFVQAQKLSIKEAVELINHAGGVSFVAHPGIIKDFSEYELLLPEGIEGIEVFHPKHTPEQRQYFYDFAIENKLLISGGSDFHSRKIPGKNKIGSAYLTEKYYNQILEYIKEK